MYKVRGKTASNERAVTKFYHTMSTVIFRAQKTAQYSAGIREHNVAIIICSTQSLQCFCSAAHNKNRFWEEKEEAVLYL